MQNLNTIDLAKAAKAQPKQAQHTPGPWHAGPHGLFVIGATDRICTLKSGIPHDEQEANASLIAAAPTGHELATLVMKWANACPVPIVELAAKFLQQAEGRAQ